MSEDWKNYRAIYIVALLILVGAFFLIKLKPAQVPAADNTAQEYSLLPKITSSVVSIVGEDQSKPGVFQPGSFGSGFVVDPGGYIATNNHVLVDGYSYNVIFADGAKKPAQIFYRNPEDDIALLKVDGQQQPVQFANSDGMQVDQNVFALGNANGQQVAQLASGEVIHLNVNFAALNGQENISGLFQTSIKADPGNSGSPIFNMNGQVLGMIVASAEDGSSFGIPANIIKKIAAEAISGN